MNDRKRPLSPNELEQLANNLDLIESENESEESIFESISDDEKNSVFSSDDSIRDKDYQPSSSELESDIEVDGPNMSDVSPNQGTVSQNSIVSENNIIWSQVDLNNFSPRKSVPLESMPIIIAKLNRGSSEVDCFFSLFPRSLFLFMAHCTNLRIDLLENSRNKKKKRIDKTSAKEMMLITGVSLIMHYNRVPSFAMYWSSNLSLGNEAIKNAISRDRCQLLLSKLYFNEPQKPQDSSKTYYIDEVISCLKNTFTKARTDSTYQSIDESMAKFKGRSAIKQYMPLKPIKRGIKLWKRCDSSTGYVYDINIYCGKENGQQEGTLGERVVNKLASTITEKNVCLCFDRFFTSVRLLNNIEYAAVGTCMKGRKDVPKFEGKLERGESQMVINNEGTLAIRWQDTKDFIALSNCHRAVIGKEKRKMKDGSLLEIDCPEAISFYNKNMGGVDLADQMTALYDLNRKSQKWWRKVYYKLLMMAVYNSYIVYKEISHKDVTFLKFIVQLAEALISEGRTGVTRKRTRNVGRHSKSSETKNNVGDHLPEEGQTRRRCYSCSQRKREKRTKILCRMCNLPLCMDCFTPFNT